METIAAIRRANLLLLLDECGQGRGAAAKLALLTGVAPPIISQLRRVTYYPGADKVERTMGDDIARKLEAGMGKGTGWMDQPHDVTRDAQELDTLRLMRALSAEQREHVLNTARLLLAAQPRPPGHDDDRPLPPAHPSH